MGQFKTCAGWRNAYFDLVLPCDTLPLDLERAVGHAQLDDCKRSPLGEDVDDGGHHLLNQRRYRVFSYA